MHSSHRRGALDRAGDRRLDEHPGFGFARISGGLRSGRKKILRKNDVFKRVINDISGFSREGARFAPRSPRMEFFAPRLKVLELRDLRGGYAGSNIQALTRSCSDRRVFS